MRDALEKRLEVGDIVFYHKPNYLNFFIAIGETDGGNIRVLEYYGQKWIKNCYSRYSLIKVGPDDVRNSLEARYTEGVFRTSRMLVCEKSIEIKREYRN